MRKQCELLGVARASIDYEPVAESEEDQRIKRRLDEIYLIDPCLGSRIRRGKTWSDTWGAPAVFDSVLVIELSDPFSTHFPFSPQRMGEECKKAKTAAKPH